MSGQPGVRSRRQRRAFLRICTLLLAVVGVQLWLMIAHEPVAVDSRLDRQLEFLFAAIAAALIPWVRRGLWKFLSKLRRPRPATRLATTAVVSILAFVFLFLKSITSGRDLIPLMHDEFQFLLQARMLSAGRLWMPPLPLPEFFDTFYVLVTPKYTAQSFVGTAIAYVPALWMHIAPWVWSLLMTASIAGMTYRIVAELIDGLAGILAAILLISLAITQFTSTMVLAQTPLLLLALAAMWAFLRWRKTRSLVAAALIGLFCGWMAVTRPVDAIVFALPILIGVGFSRTAWTAIAAAALPFLVLQIVFDVGVTGHMLESPENLYNQRDQPQLTYGFSYVGDDRLPLTTVPEKREFYLTGVLPSIRAHTIGRIWPQTLDRMQLSLSLGLGEPLLMVLIPAGLFLWPRRSRWIFIAPLPLFFLAYVPYPIFNIHYPLVIAPAAIAAALMGIAGLSAAFRRIRRAAWVATTIFVVGLMFLPTWTPTQFFFHSQPLRVINAKLAAIDKTPAIVLFLRDPHLTAETEPVFNLQTAWPDDAKVIRAHDRGADDRRLFEYYAKLGQDRAVYRFDEATLSLTYLGDVRKLAHGF
ncbi:MAG TPA: hypothetical protein VMD30_07830 [Tepidisphaeraceae bacterium]|nr:hypothetical protein [Tepidisphaeraceae bacterium]